MPADYDSALGLTLNTPQAGTAGAGYGAQLRASLTRWTGTGVARTLDGRCQFLAYSQGLPGSDWHTDTTGDNARPRLSDYSTTGAVRELQWGKVAGDWWLHLEPGATLTTAGANWTGAVDGLLRKNPWWFLRLWLYGPHDETGWVAKVEWGTTWALWLAGDGTAALLRDSVEVARGPLTQTSFAPHRPLSLCVKSIARRCLYVYGDQSEIRFEDAALDPKTVHTDPLAAVPFVPAGTWKITALTRLEMQMSECVHAAAGTVTADVPLPYTPAVSPEFTRTDDSSLVWTDETAGATVAVTAPGFTPGASESLTVSAAMATTNRKVTPIFYGAGFRFAPAAASRPDETGDVFSSLLTGARLDVDEERTSLSFTLKDAEAWRHRLNRAVLLTCGEDEVFRGFLAGHGYGTEADRFGTGEVELTADDEWKRLEKILLPSFWNMDGMKATDAAKALLTAAGYDASRWDIADSDFTLPDQQANFVAFGASGETLDDAGAMTPDGGSTVADQLRYLCDFSHWKMGFIPVSGVVKFVWKPVDAISPASVATFYATTAAATVAGADRRAVATRITATVLEPEANEIHVIGEAPGGGDLHAEWPGQDAANPAQDPTIPEADRPSNWTGERWLLMAFDPNLNTLDLCKRVLSVYVDRTAYPLLEVEFEAEWDPAVTVWSKVTLAGDARYDGEYLITGYSMEMNREASISGERDRPCMYRAERKIL